MVAEMYTGFMAAAPYTGFMAAGKAWRLTCGRYFTLPPRARESPLARNGDGDLPNMRAGRAWLSCLHEHGTAIAPTRNDAQRPVEGAGNEPNANMGIFDAMFRSNITSTILYRCSIECFNVLIKTK